LATELAACVHRRHQGAQDGLHRRGGHDAPQGHQTTRDKTHHQPKETNARIVPGWYN